MIRFEFTKEKGEDVRDLERILSSVRTRTKYLVSGRYILEIKKKATKRSLSQNALYRLWLNMMAKETGNTVGSIHEYFKSEFLVPTEREVFGKVITIEPSTKTLTTKGFSEFLDRVQAFASSELEMTLPTPQDAIAEDMLNDYLQQEDL